MKQIIAIALLLLLSSLGYAQRKNNNSVQGQNQTTLSEDSRNPVKGTQTNKEEGDQSCKEATEDVTIISGCSNGQSLANLEDRNDRFYQEGATDEVSMASGYSNGYGYVDLGLPSGTLWATCNIDASSPKDLGGLFAWGETTSKEKFDGWIDYKYANSYDEQIKYNLESSKGLVDNKTQLDLSDDAAYARWGGNWRIPSRIQMNELILHCHWEKLKYKETEGFLIEGKNGNTLFLPREDSYSSGAYTVNELDFKDSSRAYSLQWEPDGDTVNPHLMGDYKFRGRMIRPVLLK